ncbi:MAG: hypothetical protein JSR45_02735 [Proteobacteria bacterium]|jgi:hypothetical protein|nr:hypothetical protein [Pseudomonadota bacterium]
MTGRELFGVFVRAIGLLLGLYGFAQLVLAGIGLSMHLDLGPTAILFGYAGVAILGLALMRFAEVLVRFAYGKG